MTKKQALKKPKQLINGESIACNTDKDLNCNL